MGLSCCINLLLKATDVYKSQARKHKLISEPCICSADLQAACQRLLVLHADLTALLQKPVRPSLSSTSSVCTELDMDAGL